MLKIDSFSNFDAVNFLVCEVLKALKIVFFFFFTLLTGMLLRIYLGEKFKKKKILDGGLGHVTICIYFHWNWVLVAE